MTQVSARDINVTSRAATGTLATGQLALLDGRSLYQDFFGFVMWDFLPVNLNEIKQIEVIRGPASAVWGANALYGVVNVITQVAARDAGDERRRSASAAFDARRNGEDVGRRCGTSAARTRRRSTIAGPSSSRPAAIRRIRSSRPTGMIPCDRAEVCARRPRTYPAYTNTGTTQPKFDARVDYDYPDGREADVLGRRRRHRRHHAHRHRSVRHRERLGHGLRQGELHSTRRFAAVVLHEHAQRRRRQPAGARSADRQADHVRLRHQDLRLRGCRTSARRQAHVVSYGGNLRFNAFDLSLAPHADNRTEFGVYVQDEMFLSTISGWALGARVDRFDYLRRLSCSRRARRS